MAKSEQPRYAWLRERILKDITSGKYAVGSLLPPEKQLAETYGVSRHTVREATRKLADTGQISRQPGRGTVVCSVKEPSPYVAGLGTAEDLVAYTSATRLEVLGSRHWSRTPGWRRHLAATKVRLGSRSRPSAMRSRGRRRSRSRVSTCGRSSPTS